MPKKKKKRAQAAAPSEEVSSISEEAAPPEGEESGDEASEEGDDETPLVLLAKLVDIAAWMPPAIAARYGDRPIWFHLGMDAELVTVFERIPEDPISKGHASAILAGLRAFADERNEDLQEVLGPTDSIQVGFHVDAPLARVRASFEEDGFDVVEGLREFLAEKSSEADADPAKD